MATGSCGILQKKLRCQADDVWAQDVLRAGDETGVTDQVVHAAALQMG
jgi:hypothetical protein